MLLQPCAATLFATPAGPPPDLPPPCAHLMQQAHCSCPPAALLGRPGHSPNLALQQTDDLLPVGQLGGQGRALGVQLAALDQQLGRLVGGGLGDAVAGAQAGAQLRAAGGRAGGRVREGLAVDSVMPSRARRCRRRAGGWVGAGWRVWVRSRTQSGWVRWEGGSRVGWGWRGRAAKVH